jgi:hypothetical protein
MPVEQWRKKIIPDSDLTFPKSYGSECIHLIDLFLSLVLYMFLEQF